MGSVWGLQEAPYLERVRTWVHAFEPVTFTPRIVGPLLCLHKKIDYVLIRGGISSRPGGDTDPQFSVPPVTAMADNEGCALNPDGTLKESNQIQWVHSPSQETVQLPGTQLSGCAWQGQSPVFTVNPQPPAHPHTQPPSQPVTGRTIRKRKLGNVGEAAKTKKARTEGHGVQRILANCSTQSGMLLHKNLLVNTHIGDRYTGKPTYI